MEVLPKLIVVVGPTATGKSDFAVFLARKFNAETVSADSRQIYRGMDIGTGKITKKEMRGVPHHLLDVASPVSNFNVTKFKKLADRAIANIHKRGKLPILVGGTGFWIDAVAFNQNFPEVRPNKKLRARLNKLNAEKLFVMLKKIAPARANQIDRFNKVRLIRAIEIAKAGGNIVPFNGPQKYQALFIGLDLPSGKLQEKIDKRLKKRLRKGMIKEVARLHKQGVSWKKLEAFGLEYRFVAQHLQNKITKAQMVQLLSYAIKHYAKRQRTWFKRNANIRWFDPTKKATAKSAVALVKKFLKS